MAQTGAAITKLNGNLWKYYLASFFGGFAFFYNTIETLYYRSFGITFAQIGLLISASLIAALLVEVPSGAFADLYGKKISLIIAALAKFLGTVLITFGNSFEVFLMGFVLWGVGSAFESGAASALLFDSLKELSQDHDFMKHIGRAKSLYISIDIVSSALAPLLFGLNVRLPYIISLFAAFVVIVLRLMLYEVFVPQSRPRGIVASNVQQTLEGFRIALGSRIFVWLTLFSILVVIVGRVFAEMVSTPFLVGEAGYTLQSLSLIGVIASIIQTIFVFYVGSFERKLGEKRSLRLIILLFPITLVFFALSKLLLVTSIVKGTFYSTWSFAEIFAEGYVSRNVADSSRATVLSIRSLIVSLAALLILPFLGGVVDQLSLFNSLLLLGIVFLVLGIPLMLAYPTARVNVE